MRGLNKVTILSSYLWLTVIYFGQDNISNLQPISSGGGFSHSANYEHYGVLGESIVARKLKSDEYLANVGFIYFISDLLVSVDDNYFNDQDKLKFSLNNYPNPFNSQTIICYTIPNKVNVKINIFDTLGRRITTLVNEEKLPGKYEVIFNSQNLASGIYFYCFESEIYNKIGKLVFLK